MSAFKVCKLLQTSQSKQILKSCLLYRGTVINSVKKSLFGGNYSIFSQNGFRCYSTVIVSPLRLQGSPFNFHFGPRRTYVYTVVRWNSRKAGYNDRQRKNITYYTIAIMIFMLGMAYLSVPLYRIFCQATGLGGQSFRGHNVDKVDTMVPVKDRKITVTFNADVASSMRWNFHPQQGKVEVLPGETALAFYTARNPTDIPVIGISTYNVIPYEAALYFNKIQCFCFEEQLLNPHEQVDMPVFFYIDPDFVKDPQLKDVDRITLSYTFFEAKDGLEIPLPGFQAQTTPQSQTAPS